MHAMTLAPFQMEQHASDGATLAAQANEVLFVDAEHDNEVLTFREVFLGSRALELLVAGCAAHNRVMLVDF